MQLNRASRCFQYHAVRLVSFKVFSGKWLDTALALVKDMDVLKHFVSKKNEIICDHEGKNAGEITRQTMILFQGQRVYKGASSS